jgi:hypothetical protein
MSFIAQQYVQISLRIWQLQIGAYQHSYDNYQFDTKLKSFCNWGRLNISFFTFATLKIRHIHRPAKKASPVVAFYLRSLS